MHRYRSLTPKARLVRLSDAFIDYLRADGIVLPPEARAARSDDDDSGIYSLSEEDESGNNNNNNQDDEGDDEADDPSTAWPETHEQVRDTIAALGGKVTPKLNWSAPKDATWISATNDLCCVTANDVYLLLKSSDFITHDLEHAFDDTVDAGQVQGQGQGPPGGERENSISNRNDDDQNVPFYLVLRKYFNLNPSLEFRCFVRNRTLLGLCQRDLNHFPFLFSMSDQFVRTINAFFQRYLRHSFPDPSFAFDVYLPPPHDRVWLLDVNPWAPRTDPLLFSWLELLTMEAPDGGADTAPPTESDGPEAEGGEEDDDESDAENLPFAPELRLVKHDDPEAYNFVTPAYSAHKMPKDVVDASRSGPGGLREFLGTWRDALDKKVEEDREYRSEDEET